MQSDRKAQFYTSLSRWLEGGLGWLQFPADSAGLSSSERSALRRVQKAGEGVASFAKNQRWPEWAILEAGERTGRLTLVLSELGLEQEQNSKRRRKMVAGLSYPVFLLLLGSVLLQLPALVQTSDVQQFILQTVGLWTILGLAIAAGLLLIGLLSKAATKSVAFDQFSRALPGWGAVRRLRAQERFLTSMQANFAAGLSVVEGLRRSAEATQSAVWVQRSNHAAQALLSGQPMHQAMPLLPWQKVADSWQVAESTGRWDEHWHQARKETSWRLDNALDRLATWLPRLFYLAIVGFLIWQIFKFWTGYLDQLTNFGAF